MSHPADVIAPPVKRNFAPEPVAFDPIHMSEEVSLKAVNAEVKPCLIRLALAHTLTTTIRDMATIRGRGKP